MKLPRIIDVVKHNAKFERYEDGVLWYSIDWSSPESIDSCPTLPAIDGTFSFPVPVIGTNDSGGTFGATEKGIVLMRWIRKHLEYLNGALVNEELINEA